MAITDPAQKRQDESYNRLERRRFYNKLGVYLGTCTVVIGLFMATYSVILYSPDKYYSHEDEIHTSSLSRKLDSLKTVISKNLKGEHAKFQVIQKEDTSSFLIRKIQLMEKKLKDDSSHIADIRSSINPDKPEEYLKLARLNDRIEQLKQQNVDLKENFIDKERQFETSINNQISDSRFFYIAMISIMLPLIIKFLIQQFKDFKKD